MRPDVTQRLASFGYTVAEADAWVLDFIIQKVENSIKADCGGVVPEGLHEVAVDMVVGEFLLAKKTAGQLEEFDADRAVKQIQEGDTSVTFAEGMTLDALLSQLAHPPDTVFAAYRRLKW